MTRHMVHDYEIFSVDPEERYDTIAMSAPDSSDEPAAFINCFELDRQWFKTRSAVEVTEPSIDRSTCVHCIEQGEMLVIDAPCPTCAAQFLELKPHT